MKELDADDYNEAFDNDLFTYESLHLKGGGFLHGVFMVMYLCLLY